MSGEQQITLVLPEALLDALAQRVAEALLEEQAKQPAAPASPWLDLGAASAYLGFSRDKLYKLTAARAIPFHKKQGGQRLLFHREELESWISTSYTREGPCP